jgi:demethylmenaquinone methyltransferase/2-methoxy-6-polyprenyl-1,4-benzoquinol methylase
MVTTDFGYQKVQEQDKAKRVRSVFDSVASRYDLMNDLMSLGLHRLWKRFATFTADVQPGWHILDIAGGTGDLAQSFAKSVGPSGMVIHTDINQTMLRTGRDRLIDAGVVAPAVVCDAEALPFADGRFDLVSVAFGLRNMTHKDVALREMARVLKVGGKLLVLEFSQVAPPLQSVYDLYSFSVLPRLGRLVARDEGSYRYLAESIRMHPNQQALKELMQRNGFAHVDVHNLTAGVVALHVGVKCA